MRFLQRRPREVEPPDWASFMDGAGYAEFRRLLDAWLRGHGIQYREIEPGALEVAAPASPQIIGLTNLAQLCQSSPRGQWASLIDGHLNNLVLHARTDDPEFGDVRSQIKVRLYPADYAAGAPADYLVAKPLAPDIISVLTIDYPTTVATVNRDLIAKWGRGEEELFALGLANVREQDRVEVTRLDAGQGAAVLGAISESFFTTTWLLMLDELFEPPAPAGAVVGVPNRHQLLFAPMRDGSVVGSVSGLLRAVPPLYAQGPGSISPNLYWWRAGILTLLPSKVAHGAVQFYPPDEFTQVLAGLPSA